jgi:hypothetical protein
MLAQHSARVESPDRASVAARTSMKLAVCAGPMIMLSMPSPPPRRLPGGGGLASFSGPT